MPDLPTSPFLMSNDVVDRQCNRFHELFNQYLIGRDHTVVIKVNEQDTFVISSQIASIFVIIRSILSIWTAQSKYTY
jgi:hypothetical protein